MNRLLAALLLTALAACARPQPPAPVMEVRDSEVWYGAYMGGQKVGFSRNVSRTTDTAYVYYSENVIRAQVLNQPMSMTILTRVEADRNWKSRSFFLRTYSDALGAGANYVVRGRRDGEEFVIEAGDGRRVARSKRVRLDEGPMWAYLADRFILQEKWEVGKRWEFPIINPMDFSPIKLALEITAETTYVFDGETHHAFVLDSRMGAMQSRSIIDPAVGDPFHIEGPSGVSFVRESRADAEDFSRSAAQQVDLAYFAAVVPPAGPAADTLKRMKSGDVQKLRLRLHGPEFQELNLTGDYQKQIHLSPDKSELVIETARPESISPAPADDRAADSPLISPAIRETVLAVRREHPNELFPIAAIKWLQKNIAQVPTSIVPAPDDVLNIRQGDCNEFSSLYDALLAAAGYPVRIVSGVVYQDGRFFYHSWNEILSNGRWTPVDPIFDEYPASPLHVKLIEGDFTSTWRLSAVISRLKIDVISVN